MAVDFNLTHRSPLLRLFASLLVYILYKDLENELTCNHRRSDLHNRHDRCIYRLHRHLRLKHIYDEYKVRIVKEKKIKKDYLK